MSLYSHTHALITRLKATLDAFIYGRKSGPAKTGLAGAVPTPLLQLQAAQFAQKSKDFCATQVRHKNRVNFVLDKSILCKL